VVSLLLLLALAWQLQDVRSHS